MGVVGTNTDTIVSSSCPDDTPIFACIAAEGAPVRKPSVQQPRRGYSTSSALRNACPCGDRMVSLTCLTLEYSVRTTGMRDRIHSPSCTSARPMKLVVSSPVTKTMSTVSTTPTPGMSRPSQTCGCHWAGSSARLLSMVPTMRFSTQTVITSGTHSSRPVTK